LTEEDEEESTTKSGDPLDEADESTDTHQSSAADDTTASDDTTEADVEASDDEEAGDDEEDPDTTDTESTTTSDTTPTSTSSAPAKTSGKDPRDTRQCWGSVQGQAAVMCQMSFDKWLQTQQDNAKARKEKDDETLERQRELMSQGLRNCTRSVTSDGKTFVITSKEEEDGTWLDTKRRPWSRELDWDTENTPWHKPMVRVCVQGDSRITGDKNPVDMIDERLASDSCDWNNATCSSGVDEKATVRWDNVTL
jgi:hypothetical protein